MRLVILRGIPGCGKSTWAKASGMTIVCRDDLREALLGNVENFTDEGMITAVQHALIDYHLSKGRDVVVDNTNIEWKYVKEIAAFGMRRGAQITIRVFDVPLDAALYRNAQRGRMGGRQVPDHIIRDFHERLQRTKEWTL